MLNNLQIGAMIILSIIIVIVIRSYVVKDKEGEYFKQEKEDREGNNKGAF